MVAIDDMTPAQFANLAAKCGRLFGALKETGAFERMAAAREPGMDDAEANSVGLAIIADALPSLLEKRPDDVYGLLAALDGKTLAEYEAAFSPKKAVADFKALMTLLTDGSLGDFLAS